VGTVGAGAAGNRAYILGRSHSGQLFAAGRYLANVVRYSPNHIVWCCGTPIAAGKYPPTDGFQAMNEGPL